VRAAAQMLLVPVFERRISAFKAPKTEEEAEARLRLLRRLSNTLVDLLYVITAYITVIAPLLAALDVISLGWVTIVLVVLLITAAVWYLYVFQRRVAPPPGEPALTVTAEAATS
jgi:cytochrome bd-type quinol oxidase subunit 2